MKLERSASGGDVQVAIYGGIKMAGLRKTKVTVSEVLETDEKHGFIIVRLIGEHINIVRTLATTSLKAGDEGVIRGNADHGTFHFAGHRWRIDAPALSERDMFGWRE